jgi:hypothetical protein
MHCFGMTDIGHKRLVNEDQFIVADLNKSRPVHQTSLGLDHQSLQWPDSGDRNCSRRAIRIEVLL